jgi:hypothetical protein
VDEKGGHETGFADAFVVPTKRARVRELLTKPKRRREFLDSLNHHAPLDPRCMTRVSPSAQTASGIEVLLRSRGAGRECHAISSDRTVDGRTLPLTQALALVVGRGQGTVLSCIPGRLAYYEAEDPGERYVLEHAGGRTTRCS